MGALVGAWVGYPLILAVVCLGNGLLVRQLAGRTLPPLLLLPTGFAGLVVVTLFLTAWPPLARWAPAATVAIAAVGIGCAAWSWRRDSAATWGARWARVDLGAWLASAAAFVAYALPVVAGGQATFAGFLKLDDTATWLAFADRLAEAGRTTQGLAPSTYEAVLSINWDQGYPVGAFAPLAVTGQLSHQDLAWLFQPYLAFAAAVLALVVVHLLRTCVASRLLGAIGGFVAAQAALLYGYALWGGAKELVLAPLVALLAATITPAAGRPWRWVHAIPSAVVAAAVLGVMGPAGALWVAPPVVAGLVLLGRRRGARAAASGALAFVVVGAVAAAPVLVLLRPTNLSGGAEFVTSSTDIGNLVGPLRFAQVAGIWPTGDFRFLPADLGPTYLMVAIVALAALGGVLAAAAVRAWGLPVWTTTVVVVAFGLGFGNAWVAGKALAVASPGVVAAAFAAAGWLLARRHRVEAVVLAGIVVGGVLWSNVAAYHDVWLAPRDQLAELQAIGTDYRGQGPALMTEYGIYGVRHFLRGMDAESAAELRRHTIPLRDGTTVPEGGHADVDSFTEETLLAYPVLVLRNSPTSSRPPSVYRLDRAGTWYNVWTLDPAAPRVLEHVPMGTAADPVAVPPCSQVRAVAAAAGPAGQVAAVEREPLVAWSLTGASVPPGWRSDPTSGVVTVTSTGTVTAPLTVPRDGRYGLWLGGTFRSAVTVSVDGAEVWSGRMLIETTGSPTPLTTMQLGAGTHQVSVQVAGGDLLPGSGGPDVALGPIIASQSTSATAVTYLPSSRASQLCGRSLDWLEAVAR